MIRFWRGGLAAALALCTLAFGAPAFANYVVKDGSGATQTFCSTVTGGVHTPCHVTTDQSATGTLSAATSGAAYTVALGNGQGIVAFAVSGLATSGATLTLEVSNDTATWSPAGRLDGGGSSTVTADGQFRVDVAGRRAVRLRISATGTGTIIISSNASTAGVGGAGALAATTTDASGTIAAGGTYQTVLAANPARKGCLIQNPSTATEGLDIKVGTMSAAFTIPAGGTFSCAAGAVVVIDAITVTAATTGHAFSAVTQ